MKQTRIIATDPKFVAYSWTFMWRIDTFVGILPISVMSSNTQSIYVVLCFCWVYWQKAALILRFFVNERPFAWKEANFARFYKSLINNDLPKWVFLRHCQKAFLTKNSLENFSSERLSDAVKPPFWPYQTTFFITRSHCFVSEGAGFSCHQPSFLEKSPRHPL